MWWDAAMTVKKSALVKQSCHKAHQLPQINGHSVQFTEIQWPASKQCQESNGNSISILSLLSLARAFLALNCLTLKIREVFPRKVGVSCSCIQISDPCLFVMGQALGIHRAMLIKPVPDACQRGNNESSTEPRRIFLRRCCPEGPILVPATKRCARPKS
jgi:hypothetical protein